MSRVLRMSLGCLLATFVVATPAVAASSVVKASSGPLTATLSPPPHSPKVGSKPPITVTATLGGKPAKATAFYEFLFAGQVVSTQYVRGNKHFAFNGHFSDTLGPFPASAAGQPLTFRVVVKAGGRTVNLNWALSVVQ
jgi:hypothetical protein